MLPDTVMPAPLAWKPPAGIPRKLVLSFACVSCADLLFFQQTAGISVALFLVVFVGAYLLEYRTHLGPNAIKSALILPAATLPALIENVSWLSFGFAILSALTVALAGKITWYREPLRWLLLALSYPGKCFTTSFADLVALIRFTRTGNRQLQISRQFLSWILPVGASLLFLLLFAYANPVLSAWITWLMSVEVRTEADVWRMSFWVLCFFALWPLFRGTLGQVKSIGMKPSEQSKRLVEGQASNPVLEALASPLSIRRSLVLFNIVFAVQTGLDAVYLLGAAHLPDGMSYAHYAHRGAYPLVVAALLAAGFVIVAVRPGSASEKDPLIRKLVFFWFAQTLLLLLSSLWRLDLYVSAYSLTYLRVAAAIWMIIVGFGLIWTLLRLSLNQSNGWLINVNLLTVLAILHACCFVDFGGKIAMFNVSQAKAHGRTHIDWPYLYAIGPAAIPALERIAQDPSFNKQVRTKAATSSESLRDQFKKAYKGWRAFTLRGDRIARYISDNRIHYPVLDSDVRKQPPKSTYPAANGWIPE